MYNIMGFPLLLAKAGVWYEIPTKGDAASFDNIPKEVKDLVKISVKAKACGRGDVVWLCWQPCGANDTPQRVDRISSGTMLLLVTPAGARMLKTLLAGTGSYGSIPQHHFDIGLKERCSKESNAARLKMCYLVPPLGNYTTHQSGCDPTFAKGAGRPSCWNCDWVCRGTREDEDEKKTGEVALLAAKERAAGVVEKMPHHGQRGGVDELLGWRRRPSTVPACERAQAHEKEAGGRRFPCDRCWH